MFASSSFALSLPLALRTGTLTLLSRLREPTPGDLEVIEFGLDLGETLKLNDQLLAIALHLRREFVKFSAGDRGLRRHFRTLGHPPL